MKIDEKDRQILRELQKNCKQSSRQLSKKLGFPATTIHERIKKLEKEGVIKSFSAILDPQKVGLPTTAFVLAKRAPRNVDPSKRITHNDIAEAAAKLPEVSASYIVSGDYDLVLKVRGKNEREVGSHMVDKLWNLPGIERTFTLMVFHTELETMELPI